MNTRKKIAASGLLVAALAATAVPVFASDTTSPRMQGSITVHARPGDGHRMPGGPLGALVKAGTITEAQSAAVDKAMHASMDASRAKLEAARLDRVATAKTVLTQLVTAGTITQVQSDAIAAALAASPTRPDGDGPRGREHGPRGGDGQFLPGHPKLKPQH